MKIKSLMLIAGLFLFLPVCFAFKSIAPLGSDKAFIVTTVINHPNEITVNWKVADGYYLYRDKMKFATAPDVIKTITYPQGHWKLGLRNKKQEVYSGAFTIPIQIQSTLNTVPLTIHYQGCSAKGFCYPPMHKTIQVNLNQSTVAVTEVKTPPNNLSWQALLTNQDGVQNLLNTQNFAVILLLFVVLGLLLAFTPCVLPMIPILTGIIAGQKKAPNAKTAFLLSLTYVLGTAVTYAFAGILAVALGKSLQVWLQTPAVIGMISALFILLACSLFGFYNLTLPNRWQNLVTVWSNKQEGGTHLGVFLMGMLSTLIVSPCVTAPLIGVLMFIAQTGNYVYGASTLFAMAIGMGIPLLLIGTTAGRWLPKSGPWMEAVRKLCGFVMLGMAIWLLSRIFPPMLIDLCWGGLLVGVALFLGLYLPQLVGKHALHRSLGFLVGLSGMMVMVGGVGMTNPVSSWMHVSSNERVTSPFTVVHSMDEFNMRLIKAQAAHQSVILDFYADWCESCVSMDHEVFSVPKVQSALKNYVLLRADLSGNAKAEAKFLKQFKVIGPPTVIFFDAQGKEIKSQRIVGEVSENEFLDRLNALPQLSGKRHE